MAKAQMIKMVHYDAPNGSGSFGVVLGDPSKPWHHVKNFRYTDAFDHGEQDFSEAAAQALAYMEGANEMLDVLHNQAPTSDVRAVAEAHQLVNSVRLAGLS